MSELPDEGYIKFDCRWLPGPPLPEDKIAALGAWRQRMYARALVGYDEAEQVGYGNLSVRDTESGHIIVTGTQTGHLPVLGGEHYAWITGYDISANRLTCSGPVRASSESLTHAALYELGPVCNAVIHVHAPRAWRRLMHRLPTTDEAVAYGTPDMARELQRLYREGNLASARLAVMAGHPGGLIAFGRDLDEAGRAILEHVEDA